MIDQSFAPERCAMKSPMWFGVLAATVATGLLLRADEPKPPVKGNDEFAGKVVYVHAKAGVKEVALEKSGIRLLGGRPFLVGKSVADDAFPFRPFVNGAEMWVPVDDIESLAVFDNLAQLKRAAGQ
jgi:hypothetical protein